MSPPFLLDTSALLAHYSGQPGQEIVAQVLQLNADQVFTSVIAWLEFQVRLKDLTPEPTQRSEALDIYEQLLGQILPVTLAISKLAFEMREATPSHLPNVLALIAATARLRGATLLHREPQFLAIPADLLSQAALPSK